MEPLPLFFHSEIVARNATSVARLRTSANKLSKKLPVLTLSVQCKLINIFFVFCMNI